MKSKSIAEKIIDGRKEHRLSQKQLADRVRVSQATISKIEKGEIESITIKTGLAIANTLNISFNQLFYIPADSALDLSAAKIEIEFLESCIKYLNKKTKLQKELIELQREFLPENF